MMISGLCQGVGKNCLKYLSINIVRCITYNSVVSLMCASYIVIHHMIPISLENMFLEYSKCVNCVKEGREIEICHKYLITPVSIKTRGMELSQNIQCYKVMLTKYVID